MHAYTFLCVTRIRSVRVLARGKGTAKEVLLWHVWQYLSCKIQACLVTRLSHTPSPVAITTHPSTKPHWYWYWYWWCYWQGKGPPKKYCCDMCDNIWAVKNHTAKSHPIPCRNNHPSKHQTPADKLSKGVNDWKCYLNHLFSFTRSFVKYELRGWLPWFSRIFSLWNKELRV